MKKVLSTTVVLASFAALLSIAAIHASAAPEAPNYSASCTIRNEAITAVVANHGEWPLKLSGIGVISARKTLQVYSLNVGLGTTLSPRMEQVVFSGITTFPDAPCTFDVTAALPK